MASNALRSTFQTPWSDYPERVGQTFTVVREITTPEEHPDGPDNVDPEVLPMYLIRFEDGVEVIAWPEEVEDTHDTQTWALRASDD